MALYCNDSGLYRASEVSIDDVFIGEFSAPVEVEIISTKQLYLSYWVVQRASEGCRKFSVVYAHNATKPASSYTQLSVSSIGSPLAFDQHIQNLGGFASIPSVWAYPSGQAFSVTKTVGGVPSYAYCPPGASSSAAINNFTGTVNNTPFWHCSITAEAKLINVTTIKINGVLLPNTYYGNPIVEVDCLRLECPEGTHWDEECGDCVCDNIGLLLDLAQTIKGVCSGL